MCVCGASTWRVVLSPVHKRRAISLSRQLKAIRSIRARQLLLPQSAHPAAFFAAVPAHIEQVMFANHEAVPETLELTDWFEEVSLFKV